MRSRRKFAMVVLASIAGAQSAGAATYYFDVASGSWGSSGSWTTDPATADVNPSNLIPGSGDTATFNVSSLNSTAPTVTLDGPQAALGLVLAHLRHHRRARGGPRHHPGRQHLPRQPQRGQASAGGRGRLRHDRVYRAYRGREAGGLPAVISSLVIARSEATKQSRVVSPASRQMALDCFAPLAMTDVGA